MTGPLLDFIGMYVLAFLLVALNLQRIGWLRREQVGLVHVGLTVGCTLAGQHEAYGDFWWALGLMALATACSVADVTRLWCDPDNHWLQGHALWHVLSALALLFTARHHARLAEQPGDR